RSRSADGFTSSQPPYFPRLRARFSFFGAAPGRVGEPRDLVWQPGHAREKSPAPRRRPRVIRQTGNQGARAFAAVRPRGAQHLSGASARPAGAKAATRRARIPPRRAAGRQLRARASSGARMLASVASAGGPPAPPSLARLPACAPRSVPGLQQRLAAEQRAHWVSARRRMSALGWRPASVPPPKSALKSLLELAEGSLPKLARGSLLKLAEESLPELARGSVPKRASA